MHNYYLVERRSVKNSNNNNWKNYAQGLEYSLRPQAILKDNSVCIFLRRLPT